MMNRYLAGALKGHTKTFVLTLCFSLLGALMLLFEYYFVAKVINQVVFLKGSQEVVVPLLGFAFLFLVVRIFFEALESRFAKSYTKAILVEFRTRLLEKMGQVGLKKVANSGEAYNLLDGGVERLRGYYEGYLPQLMKAVFIPLLFLGFVFIKDMTSFFIMFGTIFLIPFFMILIGKLTESVSLRQWRILSQLSSYLKDVLSGIETLKVLGESKTQYEKIALFSQKHASVTLKVQRYAFLSAFVLELIGTISIALIAVGLGLRLVEGEMNYEVAFFILLLAPEYYQPMRKLGALFHTSLDAESMSQDLEAFLSEEEEVAWGSEDLEKIESLEFKAVSYRYPNASFEALKTLSFSLARGESLGIIGHSGSGKTTLFKLLLGELKPTEGEILVNKKPIETYTKKSYYKALGYVAQTPHLVQGTIMYNATLYDKKKNELFLAPYATLFSDLKEGFATYVGEGGTKLSGGQSALVALARVYNSDKSLLLLDEPTSEIDLKSEKAIVDSLPKLLDNKITLIIAHRLETLKSLSKLLLLSQGEKKAYGTYDEVIKTSEFEKMRGGYCNE